MGIVIGGLVRVHEFELLTRAVGVPAEYGRQTGRYSRRGWHPSLLGHEAVASGPAAERGRSANTSQSSGRSLDILAGVLGSFDDGGWRDDGRENTQSP